MVARLLALLILPLAAYLARADITIRVEREGSKPVVRAGIIIETCGSRKTIDRDGVTDKKGEYVCKKLPGDHKRICILISPREPELPGVAKEYDLTAAKDGVIVIHLQPVE